MTVTYGQIYEKIYPNSDLNDTVVNALTNVHKQQPVVYDIGCGYGRAIGVLLKRTGNIFAIDTDADCLEVCRQRYPTVEFSDVIQKKWPAPDLVFFNFHVLNYLTPIQFMSYLNNLAGKGMKRGSVYADFIDKNKLVTGTFQRNKNVDQTYIFKNKLSSDESSNAIFSEKIYENSNLLYTKTSKLYLWTLKEVLSTFSSSDLNFQSNKLFLSNNTITTSFCVEV